MKKFISSLLCALAGLFTACSTGKFESVPVSEFAELISDTTVQLVDVRTPQEYAAGNIAGSVNIDVKGDDFAGEALKKLDKKRVVAVYCRSGRRSKKAAGILASEGFKVVELDTGYIGWVESGR